MQIIHHRETLFAALNPSVPIALVPTMGNLHDGHLSLVERAKQVGKQVVVSIFVNPLQFGPTEDYGKYPKTLEADCEKLKKIGVDIVFAPSVETLYPHPQTCFVDPTAHDKLLEGKVRPGHFRGVATVVTKLFNLVKPQYAVFGKKDYQQLAVIRSLVDELAMNIDIIGIDTLRDTDGLALSSRNGYLSNSERAEAPRLYRTLMHIRQQIADGKRDFETLSEQGKRELESHGWQVDYIATQCQHPLQSPAVPGQPLVILGAAKLGNTRLIDNVEYD